MDCLLLRFLDLDPYSIDPGNYFNEKVVVVPCVLSAGKNWHLLVHEKGFVAFVKNVFLRQNVVVLVCVDNSFT